MLKYQQLIRENQEEIARMITIEQGKTLEDARGDVFPCHDPSVDVPSGNCVWKHVCDEAK